MTKDNEQKAVEAWEIITKSKNILLTLHPSPDEDSVGATLGLGLALEQAGLKATIILGDGPHPNWLKFFSKSEAIKLQNLSEIIPSQYDLLLAPDISSSDRISRKIEGLPSELKIISIDHHKSHTNFGHLNLIEPLYSSASQLVFELLEFWERPLSPEIATNLFLGIYYDTGFFQYDLRPEILELSAKLVKIAPDLIPVAVRNLNNNISEIDLRYQGLIYNHQESFSRGKIRLSSVELQTLEKQNIPLDKLGSDSMSNKILAIHGTIIGGTLIEKQPQEFNLSLRSRQPDIYDVSKITVDLGGGGHPAAAGATIKSKNLIEAKEKLLATINQIYPDLA